MQPNFIPPRGQKRCGRNFDVAQPGQQLAGMEEAGGVGENGKSASRRTDDFYHCAHLGSAGRIAHVSRDRARLLCRPCRRGRCRKQQRGDHRPSSELAKIHSLPRGLQGSYSPAKVAEGSTVCLEILSFTLISMRYTPGCKLAAAIDFCNVT